MNAKEVETAGTDYDRIILNEFGNRVGFKITRRAPTRQDTCETVRVVAVSPNSTCDHEWTAAEARVLYECLGEIFASKQ